MGGSRDSTSHIRIGGAKSAAGSADNPLCIACCRDLDEAKNVKAVVSPHDASGFAESPGNHGRWRMSELRKPRLCTTR